MCPPLVSLNYDPDLKYWEFPLMSHFLNIFGIQLASSLDFCLRLSGLVAWSASRFSYPLFKILLRSLNWAPSSGFCLAQIIGQPDTAGTYDIILSHNVDSPPPNFLNVSSMSICRSCPCVGHTLFPGPAFRFLFNVFLLTWTCALTNVQSRQSRVP